jgi:Uma2 family endonuclease
MVFVRATQLSTYADVTIVCGPIESQKVERNGRVLGEPLLNPTVVVEVLSDSTEDYDRGEKFAHYMRIPSLKEYVLVSQDSARIEVFRRPERSHWSHDEACAGESIQAARSLSTTSTGGQASRVRGSLRVKRRFSHGAPEARSIFRRAAMRASTLAPTDRK